MARLWLKKLSTCVKSNTWLTVVVAVGLDGNLSSITSVFLPDTYFALADSSLDDLQTDRCSTCDP